MKDAFDQFREPDRGRFGDNEQHRPGRGPRVTGASDLVDLTLELRRDAPASIAVTLPDKPGKWIFLPKSLIEYVRKPGGCFVEVTVPEWLAKEKGLI